MKKNHSRIVLAALTAATLALAGCSSAEPTDTGAPEPQETGTIVTVTETEFAITLSDSSLSPGVYTFEISNEGGTAHNFHISGPGVDDASSSSVSSGSTTSLTVTLEAGTYTVWCAIGGHRDQGMEATVEVG